MFINKTETGSMFVKCVGEEMSKIIQGACSLTSFNLFQPQIERSVCLLSDISTALLSTVSNTVYWTLHYSYLLVLSLIYDYYDLDFLTNIECGLVVSTVTSLQEFESGRRAISV